MSALGIPIQRFPFLQYPEKYQMYCLAASQSLYSLFTNVRGAL
jgi:hypothetical protein